eukprot:TRINITY_DN1448_c0_g1_i2.p1 TRINITY_DN1448_c0_g1~~TRINITY_DN1448_c0_g1_i2.p1  ORF type:complete len:112 (-),score=23.92 TRINITY_DN1448_c0_g1_i2:160-495(-)
MKVPLLILSTLLAAQCGGSFQMNSRIINTTEQSRVCAGSLTLYNGLEEVMVTEDINLRMNVDRVRVEGCGCFTLHSRKGGRGRSYFLGGEGEYTLSMRVRSVRRVECDIYA